MHRIVFLSLLLLCGLALPAAAEDAGLGGAIYTNCAGCHGPSGEGAYGVPLTHNQNLKNTKYVIAHILNGSANMPPFKEQLSPKEIAAVITYISTSWGNALPPVSAADVKAGLVKGKLK
jgi:mono/diheme cytochrome c family protein